VPENGYCQWWANEGNIILSNEPLSVRAHISDRAHHRHRLRIIISKSQASRRSSAANCYCCNWWLLDMPPSATPIKYIYIGTCWSRPSYNSCLLRTASHARWYAQWAILCIHIVRFRDQRKKEKNIIITTSGRLDFFPFFQSVLYKKSSFNFQNL